MKIPERIARELADFQQWRAQSPDIELLDYVGFVATPDLFFAFGELFAPELISHEGHWFLASRFVPVLYEQWMAKLNDPVAVQKVLNHVHMSRFFQNQEVSDSVAVASAEMLATIWRRVFAAQGLSAEAYGESIDDCEVTLFEAGPSHAP